MQAERTRSLSYNLQRLLTIYKAKRLDVLSMPFTGIIIIVPTHFIILCPLTSVLVDGTTFFRLWHYLMSYRPGILSELDNFSWRLQQTGSQKGPNPAQTLAFLSISGAFLGVRAFNLELIELVQQVCEISGETLVGPNVTDGPNSINISHLLSLSRLLSFVSL